MGQQPAPRSKILEKSVFSLDELPTGQQFEVWKDSINCVYAVDTSSQNRKDGFKANLNSWCHKDMVMVQAQSQSQQFVRSAQMAGRDGLDHYNVQLFTSGHVAAEKGLGGDTIRHGGLLLLDLAQPTEAQTSSFNSLHLFLPRRLMEDQLTNPDDHNLRFMSERDPLVRMVHDQILSLHHHIDLLNDEQIAVVQQSIVMMLVACMNGVSGENGESNAIRMDLDKLVRARRYFRQNMLSADLTPQLAASDLGMSRSHLYQLFAQYGGVNQYLRDMRLRHGLKLLSDPAKRSSSIYDIALECGYATDAGFIRAFRNRYEVTPGDVRAGVAPRTSGPESGPIDHRYENWIHGLS
ncbi:MULTISPECIES: helix-turn-helix domain-containing protein [Thalassospira]|nr:MULTISPECIES: helix-turn-helix domain-containing protein [Thalassospira]MDG4719270.1 helix-turn-helix domain-containing protein [Thalassospira sp. FZY0004]